MGVLTSILLGTAAAVSTAVGAATSLKAAHDQKKATRQATAEMKKQAEKTPVYNEKKEMTKAANQEANANARRIMQETDTIKTSALGNTGTTEVKKKTLLGG